MTFGSGDWSVRALVGLLVFFLASSVAAQTGRGIQNFNAGWTFQKADATGAEAPEFDDAAWRTVSLPHDWAIEGVPEKDAPEGQGGGYFRTGIGWYRKHFALPQADSGKRFYLAFDGVMANSDVWINGFHLGHRPYGYVSFHYDLTGHLKFGPGATNVIAVRADNSKQPASRWYAGAGIYRAVRLIETDAVHTKPWSTVVRTSNVSAASALVHLETTVANDNADPRQVGVVFTVTGPDGRSIRVPAASAQAIPGHGEQGFTADLPLSKPELWDTDRPVLYKAEAQVRVGSSLVDTDAVPFGVREFHFDPKTGFWLNGRNFKLKGAALHLDVGALGVAAPVAAYERRLNELRALGINAIRTAHNPPSPEFLDLTDRMGFLVMDEMFDCWTVGKNPYDYHLYFRQWSQQDERDTIQRDRNHPSIILWSVGNEIHDTPQQELAHMILSELVKTAHENDPTRPVTQALFRPNVSHDYDNGLADLLDVVGQNYRENELLAAHAQKPTRAIVGTETTTERQPWLAMRDHAEFSGQFLWVGADYLGESGGWPQISFGAALINRDGLPYARGYERESWWSEQPNVHAVRRVGKSEQASIDPGYEAVPPRFQLVLFHDWTPHSLSPHPEAIEVYSNADEVDLLLNGKSLGRQKRHPDAAPLTWQVDFAPGTLQAVAYTHGKKVAEDILKTAGKPAAVRLTPERTTFANDPGDVVYLDAEVVDDAGNVVPEAANRLTFAVTGPARIAGVDNGNGTDHDPFQADNRKAYQGRAIVILAAKGTGAITVKATAEGLTAGTATVTAVSPGTPLATRSF
jgi:beta-galactosidase